MIITEWAEQDRPREKMMALGSSSLTEAELLAILINTGKRGKTAVDLARDLLAASDNSLVTLSHALLQGTDDERRNLLNGIGPAKMCHIQAAFELGRRYQKEMEIRNERNLIIDSSEKIFTIFNQPLSHLDYEELWAVYCSRSGKLLFKKRISEGGINFSGGDLKKICRPAVEHSASNVALCHNHPHSNPRPSQQDIDLTKAVKEALALLDVRLLDHIIIADGKYFSLVDNGYL